MEIIRNTVPFDYMGTYRLLSDTFGEDEAASELPSLDGTEAFFNDDIVYTAEEDGITHGTVRVTVTKGQPSGEGIKISGLSGMCTDMAVRGTGLGKKLFGKIVEESDANGCEVSFLGTSNPIACNLYSSFGFSYLPGSRVMARFHGTNRVKFFEDRFRKPLEITVRELNASDRISVIPLFLNEGPGFLLDSVTGIFSNKVITQPYCMALYPKYENVLNKGGRAYAAVSERGVLGGIASINEEGIADFFCQQNYGEAAGKLLSALGGEARIRISEYDDRKADMLLDHGYKEIHVGDRKYEMTGVSWENKKREMITVPCRMFEKQ
ncbi:MAG: GNAT family N-acetyltransferase [Lachnospiraceae bacterium]|nr:GNAT family N-acetyltransferase [Lachnospiraceae bacterium]